MKCSLDIIIVNWNSGTNLKACISSITRAKLDDVALGNVIIVDNASTDNSLDNIEQDVVPVRMVLNTVNLGFAAACNQGAALANSDYMLFLNPDTILLENSLSTPIAFMQRSENVDIGICGIQMIDESGRECLSYARFPTIRRFPVQSLGINKFTGKRNRKMESIHNLAAGVITVDQVIGAFFVVRKMVFEQLCGFDELFFVYFEEVDFSFRARKNGWRSVCLTEVQCIHIGGGSSYQIKAERLFYSLRSRVLFCFKHFSIMAAIASLVMIFIPEFVTRAVFAFLSCAWGDISHTFRAYSMFVKDLARTLIIGIAMRKSGKQVIQ